MAEPDGGDGGQKGAPESSDARGEQGFIRLFEATAIALQGAVAKNITLFSDRRMGAHLFTFGRVLLALDILIRLLQWYSAGITIFAFGPGAPMSEPDDLLFISLLAVAVIMMAGGLFANFHLEWSVQRAREEVARLAEASIEHNERVRALYQKPNYQPVESGPNRSVGGGVGR